MMCSLLLRFYGIVRAWIDGNDRILLEAFTPEQMQRYEVFRRANLNKSGIKKVFPTPTSLFPLPLPFPHLPSSLPPSLISLSSSPPLPASLTPALKPNPLPKHPPKHRHRDLRLRKSLRGRNRRKSKRHTNVTRERGTSATRTFKGGMAIV